MVILQLQSPEPPSVMFNHHDAFRNAKVLKKAVSQHKLHAEKYEVLLYKKDTELRVEKDNELIILLLATILAD